MASVIECAPRDFAEVALRGVAVGPAPQAVSASVRERRLVLVLCAVAASRVLVYALAFPFFNNVDEHVHFDLVLAYSEGRIPRAMEPIGTEAAHTIALYGSPEYFSRPERFPLARFPLWARPPEQAAPDIAQLAASLRTITNHESLAPPLYYAIAGAWLKLGRALGLDSGSQLYWIRVLNVPCAAALVWLAYVTSRSVFPERRFPRVGVAALIALLPQDAFYSIQSDVLSPLCFGAAFLGILRLTRSDRPDARVGALTGLALAAAVLTKNANLPLFALAGAALLSDGRRRLAAGSLRDAAPALAWLSACAVLPFGAWLIRNQIVLGHFTGSAAQVALLGWTRKPVGAWWPHPIFTPRGLGFFLREIAVSLWRGEIVWQGRPLAWHSADTVYWISTMVCLATIALPLLSRSHATPERRALRLAFASLLASLAFLALLSVAFDFGTSFYPSRHHPYFTSGRLVSGALIPFALLYVAGLDRLLCRVRTEWPRFALLAVILLFGTVSEAAVNRVAFASPYNWLSLRSAS
jgi:hypothetical protein